MKTGGEKKKKKRLVWLSYSVTELKEFSLGKTKPGEWNRATSKSPEGDPNNQAERRDREAKIARRL